MTIIRCLYKTADEIFSIYLHVLFVFVSVQAQEKSLQANAC